MHKPLKLSLWVVPALLIALSPVSYGASQADTPKSDNSAAQSVTGCVQKGDEAGGYIITGDDGKIWELHSKKVNLSEHVGHTVTVTGAAVEGSKSQEDKIESSEKKETEGKQHGDLRVSDLKMISDSCK